MEVELCATPLQLAFCGERYLSKNIMLVKQFISIRRRSSSWLEKFQVAGTVQATL